MRRSIQEFCLELELRLESLNPKQEVDSPCWAKEKINFAAEGGRLK